MTIYYLHILCNDLISSLLPLIGHFEHGLTIRNGRIHRISERRHKDLTAAVNALLSAVERAFWRSKIIFTAVDISSSCAADEALKPLSTLQTCHDECNNQLAASLHSSNGSQWIECDFIVCNLFCVMLNDIYWSNGTLIDLEAKVKLGFISNASANINKAAISLQNRKK